MIDPSEVVIPKWQPSLKAFQAESSKILSEAAAAWRRAPDHFIASDSAEVEGTHYLVPAAPISRYLPTCRYRVDRGKSPAKQPECFVDAPAVECTYGFLRLSGFQSLHIIQRVTGPWVDELVFGLDLFLEGPGIDHLSKTIFEAENNPEPFTPWRGGGRSDLREAFYLLSFLHYASWESEKKKWNTRRDDLLAFGVIDIHDDDESGDKLRHRLKTAGIHKPTPKKQN